ncbi:MAG: hypothetical protein ACYYK0_00725 [Candidatus Eutrophobiaceae bacterium]
MPSIPTMRFTGTHLESLMLPTILPLIPNKHPRQPIHCARLIQCQCRKAVILREDIAFDVPSTSKLPDHPVATYLKRGRLQFSSHLSSFPLEISQYALICVGTLALQVLASAKEH